MTTDTLTLSAFLLARIEEDEEYANERVVAECAAKRAIVETATELAEHDDLGSSTRDQGEAILSALAAVFADHADFNPDWA